VVTLTIFREMIGASFTRTPIEALCPSMVAVIVAVPGLIA
jgi:hypothetical protein